MQAFSSRGTQAMSGELFHSDGSRKYLTQEERAAFLDASRRLPRDVETFCHVLAYMGCRLTEALALTADRVDLTAHRMTFETLKKRKRGVFRAVPLPSELAVMLGHVHDLRRSQRRKDRGRQVPMWAWSPVTAWHKVKDVMEAAGIQGYHATPKGLRHGFGVAAVNCSIRAACSAITLSRASSWRWTASVPFR
jgi:integrase/recombinase XerD